MRFLVLLLVVSFTIAAAKKGKGKGKSGGKGSKVGSCLPMAEETMLKICGDGTELSDRAAAAWQTCGGETPQTRSSGRTLDIMEMRAKRPKGKGKGKNPSKCPKPAEIMDYAADKYAGEICFFQELGWLDNDMNSDDAKILKDINTLPRLISEALTGDGYTACVAKLEKKIIEMGKKCSDKYTENEKDQLVEMINAVAHTECFDTIFNKSCMKYISNSVDEMAAKITSGNGNGNENGKGKGGKGKGKGKGKNSG